MKTAEPKRVTLSGAEAEQARLQHLQRNGPNRSAAPVDFDTSDSADRWDYNYGLPYKSKLERHPEVVARQIFDPDELGPYWVPPAEVQAAFEDVFGDYAKSGRFKLAMHPAFKRPCAWEQILDPEIGEANWRVVQVFHDRDTVKEGYLPQDLQDSDHTWEELRGQIGDFVQPDRRWFEWMMEHCDSWRFTTDEMVAKLVKPRDDLRAEHERVLADRVHDLHSHYFKMISELENAEQGCGWAGSQMMPTTDKRTGDAPSPGSSQWYTKTHRREDGTVKFVERHRRADPRTEMERARDHDDRQRFHQAHTEFMAQLTRQEPGIVCGQVVEPIVPQLLEENPGGFVRFDTVDDMLGSLIGETVSDEEVGYERRTGEPGYRLVEKKPVEVE